MIRTVTALALLFIQSTPCDNIAGLSPPPFTVECPDGWGVDEGCVAACVDDYTAATQHVFERACNSRQANEVALANCLAAGGNSGDCWAAYNRRSGDINAFEAQSLSDALAAFYACIECCCTPPEN